MTEPDPEVLPAIRCALAAPDPHSQVCSIHFTLDAVAGAMSRAWEATEGMPAERFLVAVQVAGEELDRLALAVAEATGPGPAKPE
jgi:hypothetical protein